MPARTLRAIGRVALAVLHGEGTVLATFERSLYLADRSGGLTCLGGAAIGLGPLNGVVDEGDHPFAAGTFPPGTPWRREARLLRLGRAAIDMSDALPWVPPSTVDASGGLRWALAARDAPAPRGLGPLALVPMPSFDDAVARAAGMLGRRGPVGAVDLLGLGPGLTPAGDDFLGGAMIAWRAAGRPGRAAALWSRLSPKLQARTSRISAAHLRAAAEGEGAAALHDALAGRTGAVAALDRIGHSSGWDALAGAAAALWSDDVDGEAGRGGV